MSTAARPATVLCVDADPVRQERYAALFGAVGEAGIRVVGAESAEAAAALIPAVHPDYLAVADSLPGESGAALIESVAGADLPDRPGLIYCVESGNPHGVATGIAAGADDILVLDEDAAMQLDRAVRNIDRLRRLHAALAETRRNQATEDDPTFLATRNHFRDRLSHALALAKRAGTMCAVLAVEIAGIRQHAVVGGTAAAEAALSEAAGRLKATLRDADSIARTGPRSLAVLLETDMTHDGAMSAAGRAHRALAEPCRLESGATADLAPVLGVALYPHHGEDTDTLIRNAEFAMRAAVGRKLPFAVFDYYAPVERERAS